MYDSLKRTHYILSLSMISLTHITYSWVANDGLSGFDDRLFVFDLYPFVFGIPVLHLSCFLFRFFFFKLPYKLSTRTDT